MMGTSALIRRMRGIMGADGTLKPVGEGALMAEVIYHLDAQHPEAHPTLEQAEQLVAAQAYDEPS
jgi:hypothetical protein